MFGYFPTSGMIQLIFGTNALLFLYFRLGHLLHGRQADDTDEKEKEKGKKLSKPFSGTVECFRNLTTELFITSMVMLLTWVCENNWIFEHSQKEYSRDLFLFVLILFFAYGIYTIKPTKDLTLLSRDQTEEWKGWMQFIFLLYHYFHAEEVYNSVRIMITCYVWMTGFGNFSFFYIKQDFGWLRVVQMLWRLNFAVLLLMWTHGNTYILYYICPLHTFYFFLVYCTMYFFSSVNHSQWGIRWKLMIVGVLIYIVWDVNGGLFDILFAWLGTDSVIGAKSGSVWEYYFRTSLDHYSSFFGMIFALNYPLAEQYFVKAKGWPLVVASVLMGAAFLFWAIVFYQQEKMSYNLSHAYFAIVPLVAYIFFRNLTPDIRSGVSMSMHTLGKTTLETYLLQHHIWLTSNAKTLLTIVPGHPWINFAFATVLFFVVSKELYRLTMSLRGMVLPDDHTIAWHNIIGIVAILAVAFTCSLGLNFIGGSSDGTVPMLDVAVACLSLFAICLVVIKRMCSSVKDNLGFEKLFSRALSGAGVLALMLVIWRHLNPYVAMPSQAVVAHQHAIVPNYCYDHISDGHWKSTDCPTSSAQEAFCKTEAWTWNDVGNSVNLFPCSYKKYLPTQMAAAFKNMNVHFVGDSMVRGIYHQFNAHLDPLYLPDGAAGTPALKHVDIVKHLRNNVTCTFHWAPYANNITHLLNPSNPKSIKLQKKELVVMGAGLWDALHIHNMPTFQRSLNGLNGLSPQIDGAVFSMWVLPTTILDARLNTADKSSYMTESIMKTYRDATVQSIKSFVNVVLDPTTVSTHEHAASGSVDGVHYTDEVYGVIAELVYNGYFLKYPPQYAGPAKKVPKPKPTGSMSFPGYGLFVLCISFVMLFLMDSFFGFGYLSLYLFNMSFDYEAAYRPLLNKVVRSDRDEASVTAPAPRTIDIELNGTTKSPRRNASSSELTQSEELHQLLPVENTKENV